MEPTYLSGRYAADMTTLRIRGDIRNPQTRRSVHVDETAAFKTYLVLALQNIGDILRSDLSGMRDPDAVERAMGDEGRLANVASFLWLHRADNPGSDYGHDYGIHAREIVVQLWKLRNMFFHGDENSDLARALVVSPGFYRFVEGELFSAARDNAFGPRAKTEKLFKLRLFTPHNNDRSEYEFTRRGIIFLICLALYKQDASEFLQKFGDLQSPPREWEVECGMRSQPTEDELVKMRKKGGSVKAIADAFTYYSMRSSRTDIDLENKDYLNFANILTYLNKVPSASYNYLSLDEEAGRLATSAKASTGSDENKRFKYVLHERRKDRFLTLALAYLEDFNKLPCIKFKRLDITPRLARRRYMFGPVAEGATNEFGEPISDANGMDRHYAVDGGVAQFEFVPEEHYGDVRIKSIRGGIGENELMRLMLVMLDGRGLGRIRLDVNGVVKGYLAAYHRILERMLNAETLDQLTLDDEQYRADFKLVSGKVDEALDKARFVEEMKPFFSPNVTRFFVGSDARPGRDELRSALVKRLHALKGRAEDFMLKLDKLSEWRRLDVDARRETGFPVCRIGELRFPPRTCNVGEDQMIRMVFNYLNLYIADENKFRQLPRGQRHRGTKDFGYQLLHRDIGRFGVDQNALWNALGRCQYTWNGTLNELKRTENQLFKAEQTRCRGLCDANGNRLEPRHTLSMLAYAAAKCYADACGDVIADYESPNTDCDVESDCKWFGVRTGMPVDKESLVKSILGIDIGKWSHAYDYENGRNFTGRQLGDAANLVVSQVPVPNSIAIRCIREQDRAKFKFNPAFRDFLPFDGGRMALRKYYDASPLIESIRVYDERSSKTGHDRSNDIVGQGVAGVEARGGDVCDDVTYGKEPPRAKADFSRSAVNKAIQAIQLAERQDKVLLECAHEYWNRYVRAEAQGGARRFPFAENADIWSFFTTSVVTNMGGISVQMMPNDFARPSKTVVERHLPEIARLCALEHGETYAFYDLWLKLRDLQRKEGLVRQEFLPIFSLFDEKAQMPRFDGADVSEVRERMYSHLQGNLYFTRRCMTREEFGMLVEFEDRLRHPARNGGIGLLSMDQDAVRGIMKRLGFTAGPEPNGGAHEMPRRRPKWPTTRR